MHQLNCCPSSSLYILCSQTSLSKQSSSNVGKQTATVVGATEQETNVTSRDTMNRQCPFAFSDPRFAFRVGIAFRLLPKSVVPVCLSPCSSCAPCQTFHEKRADSDGYLYMPCIIAIINHCCHLLFTFLLPAILSMISRHTVLSNFHVRHSLFCPVTIPLWPTKRLFLHN